MSNSMALLTPSAGLQLEEERIFGKSAGLLRRTDSLAPLHSASVLHSRGSIRDGRYG
jgi:hypothetical protein